MRSLALLLLLMSPSTSAADVLTRDQARAIVEQELTARDVTLGHYALAWARQEANGEWRFLYQCTPHRRGCRFLVILDGRREVTITQDVDEPRSEAIPESIQEAVFAHEITPHMDLVVCISIAGTTPSAGLLARLARTGSTVVDASECTSVTDVHQGSYHVPSGRPAIFYRLGGLERIDAGHATIGFETYRHGLHAEDVTLSLRLRGGKWVVVGRKVGRVS